MKTTIPLAQIAMGEDQVLTRLVAIPFLIALVLLAPAGIEVARRGCRALRRQLAVWSVQQRREPSFGKEPTENRSAQGTLCEQCREEIDVRACEWPFCHHALPDYSWLSFDEKLRLALTHPVGENRILAIELLEKEKGRSALATFRELVPGEKDPRVVAEIARATSRIGGDEARAILFGLKSHGSEMVREIADRLWRETSDREFQRRIDGGMTSPDERMAV